MTIDRDRESSTLEIRVSLSLEIVDVVIVGWLTTFDGINLRSKDLCGDGALRSFGEVIRPILITAAVLGT